MNKIVFKQQIMAVLLGLGISFLPVNTYAEDAVDTAQLEECSQEILLSYFPSVFVAETLNRFNVPKDQWEGIKKDLAEKDKEIIKTVEAKAAKMDSNPLKDPQQRQAAVKIFRETLTESFSTVMKAHGVTDDKQIQAMLDDIQQQKAKRFARCMEVQRQQQKQPELAPQKNISDAQSDSDDEEDEE